MKLRVIDRLLCALSGLILLVVSAALAAETLFHVQITAWLGGVMKAPDVVQLVAVIAGIAVIALLGVYGVSVLFRRRGAKRGFVLQKTENGELSISIKAIEGLVQKCVDKHEELRVTATALESSRDGLIVKLRVALASGLNIPLAVNALQKQIRQYITACSGIDVKEVRVQVEGSVSGGKPSPYDVPEMLQNPPPLPREEEKPTEIPAPAAPAEEKEEKCLHQRLFGSEEQPVIFPAPPAPVEENAAEPAEASVAEAAEEPEPDQPAAEEAEEVNHEVAE